MGGNAFSDSEPMEHEVAERATSALRAITGWNLEPVGSFGFKSVVPDLDLVTDELHFRPHDLQHIGEVKQYGLGGVGLRFDFEGAPRQIDFFPAASIEWGKFARGGAADSGAYRALLLKAAAATYFESGKDFVVWRGDEMIARAARTLDQRYGLRRIYQHRIREDGKGYTKHPKTVDAGEFKQRFGVEVPDVPVITDPVVVRRMILGDATIDGNAADIAEHMRRTFDAGRLRRVDVKLRERGYAL